MPTSWNNPAQIDNYLGNNMSNGDALVFEAHLLLNPELVDKMQWQQKTYMLVQSYGRRQLKQEIEAVHQQLFTHTKHSRFSQKIMALFKKL
ncbi:MAG: hypothetical protein ABI367_12185 [Mucilaginibacter sp.]